MFFSFESIDNVTLTNVQIGAFFFKSNLAKFLKKFFSIYVLVKVDSFELYYQEFILRTLLQNSPSKICQSKMSWSVVYGGQRLEIDSVFTSGRLVQHGMWIHAWGSIQ